MISAYETIECEQQKMTTQLAESVKTCLDDRKLDNSDLLVAGRMEKIPSSLRASLLASDSSFEESAVSSTENSILPSESYDEDVNEERENNDEERNLSVPLKLINNTSEMDKSRNEESSEDTNNDKYEETKENRMRESISISAANSAVLEGASTCRVTRNEQIREQRRSKDQSKNKQNQILLEIQMQERVALDDSHADENPTVADVRVCCENVMELRLDTDERRDDDDIEREMIWQQDDPDNKLFYDAVRSGNAKRVSALISSGCVQNLDEPDWNMSGDPPLLVAATNHYLPVLR